MDNGLKLKKVNPKTSSNILSKAMFFWMIGLFRRSMKGNLKIGDMFKPEAADESAKLTEKLEAYWESEVLRAKKIQCQPSLMRVLMRAFFWRYMFYGILLFLQFAVLRVYQPVVLAQLIRMFSSTEGTTDPQETYICGAILSGITFVYIFWHHHLNFELARIGMRVRVACSSLIYRKLLKLSKASSGQTASGQVVNLLSNDVQRFDLVSTFLHFIWIMPIEVAILTFFIWEQVGISSLSGVLSMVILTVPLHGYLGKVTIVLRLRAALRTDERVRKMNEIVSGIQVIKLYAWEKPFEAIVKLLRLKEINVLTHVAYVRGVFLSFAVFTERLTLYVTIICYVLLGNTITADRAFSMAQFFNNLQLAMAIIFPLAINTGAETLVTVHRLETFLALEERTTPRIEKDSSHEIIVKDIQASWISECKTLNGLNINIPAGCMCAIVGPVGSGKSSFLQLLLGELPAESGIVKVGGSISYASQEPWLFLSSVRKNILFGQDYDQNVYKRVVKVCALERDFELFPNGDKTFVGERGVSLSGGQRARINLARAVYKKADIYLLDDPLSAVDTHVGKQLFEECIMGYLKGKTRILVTHQLQFLKGADHIIVLNEGRIEAQGTFEELSKRQLDFTKLLVEADETDEETRKPSLNRSVSILSTASTGAKSEIYEFEEQNEETYSDKQDSSIYFEYFRAGGNVCKMTVLLLAFLGAQAATSGADYWLSFWTTQEAELQEYALRCNSSLISDNRLETIVVNNTNTTNLDNYVYTVEFPLDCSYPENIVSGYMPIYIYTAFIVGCIALTVLRSILFFKMSMKAARRLHNKMFFGLLRAPMRFFDTNPSGRILNRFSRDMGAIDEILPRVLLETVQVTMVMIGILVMVSIANYYMLIVIVILAFAFAKLRDVYIVTAKNLKHLEGIAKSPVFSHINSSLNGITTIRASNAENVLRKEFDSHQDVHTSAWYLTLACVGACGLWLDVLSGIFVTCIVFSFILMSQMGTVSDSMVGLAISQSLILTGMVQYGMRQLAEVVSQMTSVERVFEYTKLEQEAAFEKPQDKKLSKGWPEEGRIQFQNLYLLYTPNDAPVLKNLNFVIEHGQKVGIVGRTGAGKSSLISALFRLAPTEGSITIDNVDTKTLGLNFLRRHISIIPQEPMLFSASMRFNLDPFNEFEDTALWNALEEVELKDAVSSLDVAVQEGGSNLSVGQRQLVCLARAILRNNKILVLDEATANVDHKTDALIQATIRRKFRECTVLTIAHRLNTIMDSDKVLVMDAGEMVEFDHPHMLLQNRQGYFYKMVAQTGKNMSTQLHGVATNKYLDSIKENTS